MVQGKQPLTNTYPAYHRIKRVLFKLSQYFLLLVLFILLAGHENINPRLGKSHIDFYKTESQHLLEINAKAWLISKSSKPGSINYKIQELTNKFYHQRNYAPIWTINYSGAGQLMELISLVDSAEFFGLPKSVFNSNKLIAKLDLLESNTFGEEKIGERIDLELEATQTAMLYMIYLARGIVYLDSSDAFNEFANQLPDILNTCIQENTIQEGILAVQPDNKIYRNIISELPDYLRVLNIATNSSEGIAKSVLSKILHYTGNLSGRAFDSLHTVDKTISEFQVQNSLNVNGMLNASTVKKMAEILYYRYKLIALNLDRLRKANINSSNYLFVNIPEFRLHVFNNDEIDRSYNVVVGKRKTPTPVLSSQLKKIITNPYWTVPRSIVNNEMLSRIRTDSTYLERNGYFIINGLEEEVHGSTIEWESDDPLGKSYWLRQDIGRGNALGKVKFIFPNDYRVFLHDTPSKRLFKKQNRAYSHGCIRVENPEELAQYLSDNYYAHNNSPVNIKRSIARKKREEFLIESRVDVHVQYITCSIDEDKRLVFYKDLYKKDKKELELLFSEKAAI